MVCWQARLLNNALYCSRHFAIWPDYITLFYRRRRTVFKLSINVASRIATDKTMTHYSNSVFLQKLNFMLNEIGSESAKYVELWSATDVCLLTQLFEVSVTNNLSLLYSAVTK